MGRVRRILVGATGAAVLFTGVVGFAHTPAGRPLLRMLGRALGPAAGSCPLGYDRQASPEQREEGRRKFAATHAGSAEAADRPALGFVLDHTQRADVLAWAKAHGVQCDTPKVGSDLVCKDVPSALLPGGPQEVAAQELWLNFGGSGALISVTAIRQDPNAEPIGLAFHDFKAMLTQKAGAPATEQGTGGASELKVGALSQATVEYRFRTYYALARATNMGNANGYVLTEEYRSLPN